MGKLREFLRSMRVNPRLSASTVNEYRKVVSSMVRFCDSVDPSVDKLNEFIAMKCGKRQSHAKYALKHYLEFIGRGEDYDRLVKAKVKKPVRDKHFLSRAQRFDIIDGMKSKVFRDVAWLQEVSAARSREILSIQRHRIRKKKDGVIKIMLMGKGGKPRPIFLKPKFMELLKPYLTVREKAFIFLEPGTEFLSEDGQRARLETAYKRYLEELQASARSAGFEGIGTHDLRRSKSDELHRSGIDVRKVQILLGHSSSKMTERYLSSDEETIERVMLDGQG